MYQIIQSLREAQGSKAKQALLNSNADNVLLRNFMQAVYDPALSYYQTKLPKIDPLLRGIAEFSQADIDFARGSLASREVSGHAAKAALAGHTSALNADGRELMAMLVKRSIGGSIGETMVLKTWPGLFFVPPYMRCAGMSAKVRDKYAELPYFYVQTKYDGQFAYLKSDADSVELFTRAGNFFPSQLALKLGLSVPPGTVLMGELLVYREGKPLSRKESNGVLNSLLQADEASAATEALIKAEDIRLIAWDLVTVDEFNAGKSSTRYELRQLMAKRRTGTRGLEFATSTKVQSLDEAFAIHRRALKRGEEGTVWKTPEGLWTDTSTGTQDAVKVKIVFEAEFKVVGKYEGEGKYAGMLGGFSIETSCGLIANNVGSGFSDKQRIEFWEADTDGWIVTLEANDVVSEEGSSTESLFLPIFIERRLDKVEADSRERVMEQLRQAREGV